MATFDSLFVPAEENGGKVNDLGTTTASSEITLGRNTKFIINADGDVHIRFGLSTTGGGPGTTDPTVASFRLPANVSGSFDLGHQFDSFKVFNPSGASTIDVYYIRIGA